MIIGKNRVSSFSAMFIVIFVQYATFCPYAASSYYISIWLILTNACNAQISNNLMYYFSSSMIFFYDTSYLNFQIFGKKSLNFIISRNIIEDIHYVMHKCTWDTNQIIRISVKNRKYYLLLLFGC